MSESKLSKLKSAFSNLSFTDYFDNTNAPGFTPNMDKSLYNHGSSTQDATPPQGKYDKNNKYEDNLPVYGDYPATHGNLIQFSNNPLITNHWTDIGGLDTGTYTAPGNVSQQVDFMKGENSYFGPISPFVPGFTQLPVLKETLYGGIQSNLSDGVGGIFNQTQNYSELERLIINSPKGYVKDSEVDEAQILVSGNMATQGNQNEVGQGYPSIKSAFDKWSIGMATEPVKYNSNDNLTSPVLNIPNSGAKSTNDNVNDITRKLTELGKGDYTYSNLFKSSYGEQKATSNRSGGLPSGDPRLNLRPDGWMDPFSGWRGSEPYYIAKVGGGPFLVDTSLSSRTLPLGRSVVEVERLAKFILTGAGVWWVAKETLGHRLNTYQPRFYNPLSLASGIPILANIRYRMSRGIMIPKGDFTYKDYVYETKFPNGLMGNKVPTNLQANMYGAAAKIEGFDAPSSTGGGNVFQVLGANSKGDKKPDFTMVSPAPRDLISLFYGPGGALINNQLRSEHASDKYNRDVSKTAPKEEDKVTKIFKGQIEITNVSTNRTYDKFEKLLGGGLSLPSPVPDPMSDNYSSIMSTLQANSDGAVESPNSMQQKKKWNTGDDKILTLGNLGKHQAFWASQKAILNKSVDQLEFKLVSQFGNTLLNLTGGAGLIVGRLRDMENMESAVDGTNYSSFITDAESAGDTSGPSEQILSLKRLVKNPNLNTNILNEFDNLVDKMDEDAYHNDKNIMNQVNAEDRGLTKRTSQKYNELGTTHYQQTKMDEVGPKYPLALDPTNKVNTSNISDKSGDLYTLIPKTKADDLDTLESELGLPTDTLDSETNGAPFYFKDLRDNSYLMFRGYVEGMTDTISPTWNSTQYVGRSEPIYTYSQTERALAFNLKVFALTQDELDQIYDKLNHLTGCCYPQYKLDITNFDSKVRMKPPLLKFRYADLYGKKDNEILGFIESLTYTFPETSPWETIKGKRVPKHVEVAVGYKAINSKPPHMNTRFFGYDSITADGSVNGNG